MTTEPPHIIGKAPLYDPAPGEGSPDDFLVVPDATTPLSFVDGNGRVVITLTEPFVTDGATTPWFLQPVPWLRRYGRIRHAAFFHDWAWVLHHLGRDVFGFRASNAMFYEACLACGLRKYQAFLCWLCVTLFGWPMWMGKEKRRRQAMSCLAEARTSMRMKGISR